jgi:fatty acid desaturase
MDHKAFLATLPAGERAQLTEVSDGPGVRHLMSHGGLILLGAFWIGSGLPFWGLVLPAQGLLIAFLFTLEHECTHKTPFRSERLNEGAGRVAGFLLALPFEWFRYFHLAHHRFTNLPGRDPELAAEKPEGLPAWLLHVSGLPYWRANLRLIARLCLGRERPDFLPAPARPRAERQARVMAGLYLAALGSLLWSPLVFWVWLLPALIGQPFLRLYLLAEHGDCPMVADMFENTRTTFTNRIVYFLAWNMPYHVEHHVMPAVPFHRLPDLHRHVRAHLKVTAEGYAAFSRDYLARRM